MSVESDIINDLCDETILIASELSPPLRIAMPRVEFAPVNSETYLEIRHFPNTNLSRTWGEDRTLIGIWQISVIVTGDQVGDIEPTDIAGIIERHFRKNKRINKIKIYLNPTVLTPITAPDKTTYPVSIPYRLDLKE